jgi:glycosyltransferase involved in cell wall biosynthesis
MNGFVVPERDRPALTQAMDQIMSDENLQEKMSANARWIVAGVAGYDNERMVKGLQQAIEYAMRREGTGGGKETCRRARITGRVYLLAS